MFLNHDILQWFTFFTVLSSIIHLSMSDNEFLTQSWTFTYTSLVVLIVSIHRGRSFVSTFTNTAHVTLYGSFFHRFIITNQIFLVELRFHEISVKDVFNTCFFDSSSSSLFLFYHKIFICFSINTCIAR